MNVIMLGVLVKEAGLEGIDWKEEIKRMVKPRFMTINIQAFELGFAV